MSKKRDLYKPVVQENSNNAGRRRPLAQGRLVTKPLIATGHTVDATRENVDCPTSVDSQRGVGRGLLLTSPRRDRSSLMADLQSTNRMGKDEEISPATPRKHQSHASMEQSPTRFQPTQQLELSDTESESGANYDPQIGNFYESFYCDRSKVRDGGVVLEDINVPAPLVHVSRHSPTPVHCDIRNTGNVSVARKIPIDQVKSISIIDTENTDQYSYSASLHREVSPGDRSTRGQQFHSPTQQLFPDTDESTSNGNHSRTTDEAGPTSKPTRLSTEDKNRKGAKPAEMTHVSFASTISEQDTTKRRVKKKPPKVVKSRYMMTPSVGAIETSAVATSSMMGPMKATNRSLLSKTSASAPRDRLQSSSKAAVKRKTATKSFHSSLKVHADSTKPSFSLTPQVKAKSESKASTPSQDVSLQPLGGVDVSAIAHVHGKHLHSSSIFSTPSLEGSAIDTSALHSTPPPPKGRSNMRVSYRNESHDVKNSHHAPKSEAQSKHTVEGVQNQLTNTYCRYLQWAYLDAKARKASHVQENVVMDQLYNLWSECEKLETGKTNKTLELEHVKHLSALDDVLDLQEKVLVPICENLGDVATQYKTFSSAIDTTRHHMPILGVVIPDDDFIDALELSLVESEQLLTELHRLTRPHAASIGSFSTNMCTIRHTAEKEVEVLDKVQELVSASQTLITQESSLLVQDMQASSS